MKMLLVKPGKQKNGQIVTWEDLKQVVSNFNPSAPPPVTLGHPLDSRFPAFGRVKKVWLTNEGLAGEVEKTPELIDLEKKGYFKGWSVGLKHSDNGYYLHHLAMCGELPPASNIKELSDIILTDEIKEEIMDREEIKKIIEEATKPLIDKINLLEARLEAKNKEKTDEDSKQQDQENQKEEKQGELKEEQENRELAAALSLLKKERINRIKDLAKAKGLTEEQIKPFVEALEKLDISLSDGEDIFEKFKIFISTLPAKPDKNLSESIFGVKEDESINFNKIAAKM